MAGLLHEGRSALYSGHLFALSKSYCNLAQHDCCSSIGHHILIDSPCAERKWFWRTATGHSMFSRRHNKLTERQRHAWL